MGLECVAQKRERARPARPPPMVVAPRPLPPPSHERLRAEAHPYYRQQQQHALQASPFQQALGPGFAPGPPGLYSVPFVLRDGTVFTKVTEPASAGHWKRQPPWPSNSRSRHRPSGMFSPLDRYRPRVVRRAPHARCLPAPCPPPRR